MRTLGKYQILGLLGRGGMGVVYKARHLELGRMVALKVLQPMDMLEAVVGMPELENRFMAEARTMAGLDHPNIATVWDCERLADGRLFFVMDYCCNNVGALIGETYRVEAPSRVLRLDRAVDIARQTLLGLERLHFAGIVHRDIKPFNLLLDGFGGVQIIDFGLSKLRGEVIRIHGAENVGSPYYASPEQEQNPEAATEQSDLFSVGVMLERMLTGQLPQLSDVPPSQLNSDLNADWDAFFACALAEAPGSRFSSAREMREALERLFSDWQDRTKGVCSLPDEEVASDEKCRVQAVRTEPIKTGPKTGADDFALDSLWRPKSYCSNAFSLEKGMVRDEATGLLWQQGGTAYHLGWEEACAYVQKLNADAYAGFEDWRLPTVAELMTLLAPVTRGRDFCIEPVFDEAQSRLWSADVRTFTSAWVADTELGFICSSDMTCRNFARAVRSLL